MELILLLMCTIIVMCAILGITTLVIKLIKHKHVYIVLLFVYGFGLIVSSVHIYKEYHRLSNRNTAEINFTAVTGNTAELNFIPLETGSYSIGLRFLNQQEISAMEVCRKLAFDKMYESFISEKDLITLEKCRSRIPYSKITLSVNGELSNYGDNYININNANVYDNSTFLYSKGNTYTLLPDFQFQKGSNNIIKITISNELSEILKSEPMLIVYPNNDELLTLEDNTFIFYLPLMLFTIAMIIYLSRKLISMKCIPLYISIN